MANGKSAVALERPGPGKDTSPSDGELLRRFNARLEGSSETAFEVLVRRHGPMVLRVCRQILEDRHGAEDAFQATFLILARKAGSIRSPEALGSWLYGVSVRTAREARMREGLRRRREVPNVEDLTSESGREDGRPERELIGREEVEALHEEVSRLPEIYRLPVVLCELEGLTYEEVARRMRCPVGTIGVRLLRARERLRSRLIRRGIAPVAALMETIFGGGGSSALMSTTLIQATVRGASVFAAGDVAAMGCVSASTFTLTHAVLGAMALARLKLVAGSALLVAIFGVGWIAGHSRVMVQSPSGRSQDQAKASAPASRDAHRDIAATVAPEVRDEAVESGQPVVQAIAEAPRPQGVREKKVPSTGELSRLAREERARGEALFFKEWMPHDPASPRGDGLGPMFNATSCVSCHGLGAPGGAGPESKNVVLLSATSSGGGRSNERLEKVHPGFHSARSTVLHRYGTDSSYASWRRNLLDPPNEKQQGAKTKLDQETFESRMQRIARQTSPKQRAREQATRLNPADGISLRVSERNTPALFGAGRIDSISSEVLVSESKAQPQYVRGRVSRDRDGRVGRFGWKAQVSRLHEFVRVACAGELGLEVPGHHQSASPMAPLDRAKGLDLTEEECDELVSYVRALPAPVAIDPAGPQGTAEMVKGRHLFGAVGCATCHAPSLGDVRGIYSDLLLHEMGQFLSDSGEYYGSDDPDSPGGPSPGEWRTPPLWGFRDSAPYLHDGRAENLEEAVALHGGQGATAARLFFELEPDDRFAIEAFLKSLVAPSSASAPGIVLAAELEARFVPDEARQAEIVIRARREQEVAREVERQREDRKREIAAQAARLAPSRLQIASNLEKSGKTEKALEYYRSIAREAPETEEAKLAVERISSLRPSMKAP